MRRFALGLSILIVLVFLQGCSWVVPFFVVNDSAVPRAVEIQLSKERDGFLIFDPRHFTLLPWRADEPGYEGQRDLKLAWQETLRVEIPPHSALRIGHLNNDNYENSRQKFINARIFNLVRLKAAGSEVTRDTFDQQFRKTSAGVVWKLPG